MYTVQTVNRVHKRLWFGTIRSHSESNISVGRFESVIVNKMTCNIFKTLVVMEAVRLKYHDRLVTLFVQELLKLAPLGKTLTLSSTQLRFCFRVRFFELHLSSSMFDG